MRGWLPLAVMALLATTARADYPSEFPPRGSERRVTGTLIDADFIHRCGVFRDSATGQLVDFKLLPCGLVTYLNAGGDLRDVPLGTLLQFSLLPDERGAYTRAAAIADDFSLLASQGVTYHLDQAPAGGTLKVTKPNAGRVELRTSGQTRVWKGDRRIELRELAVGDALAVNLAAVTGRDLACADIWAGPDTQKQATADQRKRHTEFLKERGLPGWVQSVEGKKLAVTLFGDPDDMAAIFKAEGIDSAQWATKHQQVRAVVANQDLRSYNPGVDGQGSTILEYRPVPTDRFGCSGVCWVIQPSLLLEGFRKGRVIRLFAPSWRVHDMPFGEGLYSEVPNAKVEDEPANQYPFRTDFGNEQLPWYQMKPGEFPPHQSYHLVCGELVKADASQRAGQFRVDRTGELIDFTMPPYGTVLYHNTDADLADVPLGTRCFFYLYEDAKGAFTRAAQITDDFTNAISNDRITYRLDAANLDQGTLLLARQLGPMKDELDHLVQPPDLGRGTYAVDDKTGVWKGGAEAKLSDLAAGDQLLINVSGRTATNLGRCTEIWAGADAHKRAAEQQRAKHAALLKEQGAAAWVDSVEGKDMTITFFAANRKDFATLLDADPWGKGVLVAPADEQLHAQGPAVKWGFRNHLPEGNTFGSVGCSGVRWVLESPQSPPPYKPGQIIRLWKEGWPAKGAATGH